MNNFELVVAQCADSSEECPSVEIVIDGVRLIDLVKRVEEPYATHEGSPSIAGAYGSLSAMTTLLPSRHFLGEARPLIQSGAKTVVLICDCGCAGCWDFACKITVTELTVTWSDFEQIHRNWDYSALGEFVFDRLQYENALRLPPKRSDVATA